LPPFNLHQFWQYDEQLESSLVVITPPPSTETVLDVLGNLPLKPETPISLATTQAVMEHLRSIYAQVSQQAVLAAMTTGNQDS
jgi:uncharacterized Zn finger protein